MNEYSIIKIIDKHLQKSVDHGLNSRPGKIEAEMTDPKEACFTGRQIRGWKQHLIDMAFNGYPREYLIDLGYIPFADWYDWGLLCFDTNRSAENNEYAIVLWDHDRWDEHEFFCNNFHELLVKLDKESVRDEN